jgi:hypothetical protein
VIELSRSFECVYVEISKNSELAKQYLPGLLDVVLMGPDGRELARYAPKGIYDKGDPAAPTPA